MLSAMAISTRKREEAGGRLKLDGCGTPPRAIRTQVWAVAPVLLARVACRVRPEVCSAPAHAEGPGILTYSPNCGGGWSSWPGSTSPPRDHRATSRSDGAPDQPLGGTREIECPSGAAFCWGRFLRPQDGLNRWPCRNRAEQNTSQWQHIRTRPCRSEGHQPTQTNLAPNSRAADSVRSGKVDTPTPQNERFRRSEACTGGAGGTRTHGRRIMSPSGILATLVDQRSSMTFLQVRAGMPCQHPFVFVGLFLSLRPERVPNASRIRRMAKMVRPHQAVAPARKGVSNSRAADSPSNAQRLHPGGGCSSEKIVRASLSWRT